MANPYMEYPKPTRDKCQRWRENDGLCDGECYFTNSGLKTCYHEDLNKYHSGLLPFEESSDILRYIKLIKNDTIVLVDLEVEVVEQEKSMSSDEWIDYKPGYLRGAEVYAIRKVLRIKP